jgi:nocardicin N-oxygenase
VPPAYAELRARCPVSHVTLPSGDEGYLVTRYEDVKAVLGDPRFSRAATVRPGAPRLTAVPFEQNGLFTMDPPEHTRLRALAAAAFTPRRVRDLTPRIAEITGELLDTLAKGPNPADLANTFAVELPTAVICELLGVPFEDRDRFRVWSDAILSLTSFTPEQMAGHRSPRSPPTRPAWTPPSRSCCASTRSATAARSASRWRRSSWPAPSSPPTAP